ncbi:MAG: sigma-70 family RNA polymerase sigma factor [Xanthomonadales bacterium]|nr:sigma-70 family RNA polymerase sigma factor [Xanthomonadales bacterium]
MRDLNDEELMLRYAAGEMQAFEELYGRYRAALYRYFRRQVPDEATANDLYQGCWEKAIAARSRYRARAPFRAWLFRIAHNHVVDHHRAQRPGADTEPDQLPGAPADPGDLADDTSRRARLAELLGTLPFEQRNTLLLHFESGLDLEAIGQLCGVGRETVKSRLRYATRKLKQALSP